MVSSEMLRRVALVRTDVSEELIVSFIRVTRIGKLRRTLAVTSNRRTLRRKNGAEMYQTSWAKLPPRMRKWKSLDFGTVWRFPAPDLPFYHYSSG
jgi:hypothetical protein